MILAFAAAGCAQDQDAHLPVAPTPYGIDNMAYGPAPMPGPGPGPAPVARGFFTGGAITAGPATGRGLLAGGFATAPAPLAPAPALYAPPRQVYAPPPVAYAPAPAVAAYSPMAEEGLYTLDSGDRLRIVVFGQDGLTNSYAVDASGYIAVPLIGPVLARGATTEQLSARISGKLSQGYIREPHVVVEIEAYRPFFILGEVTAPGQYPYVANMTVETAVAIAGGFGPRGYHSQVTINRNIGGRVFRFSAPVTYQVRPGDTILVKERWF